MFIRICLGAVLAVSTLLFSPVYAESAKATNLVGQVVVTADGELLGRVEDIAVNVASKSVDYVVVSIGSFLVDDNLIAVHTDDLGQSEDGRYLVVYSDDLDSARRFGADNWPDSADVLPGAGRRCTPLLQCPGGKSADPGGWPQLAGRRSA